MHERGGRSSEFLIEPGLNQFPLPLRQGPKLRRRRSVRSRRLVVEGV